MNSAERLHRLAILIWRSAESGAARTTRSASATSPTSWWASPPTPRPPALGPAGAARPSGQDPALRRLG
jgi:hypothetical protein